MTRGGFLTLFVFAFLSSNGTFQSAAAQSRGAPPVVPVISDASMYALIHKVAGQCISTAEVIQKDYLARRRQGMFLKSGQFDRQVGILTNQKNQLIRGRGPNNQDKIDTEVAVLDLKIAEASRQARLWDDRTINGYQLYFKDPWERKTGRLMKDIVPGFKIRGGQPLLNYDIMIIDALARTLVNEAGLCEQAAESHLMFGRELCKQRCGKTEPCFQKCVQAEEDLGESQKGLHYAMVISSIFDRKLLIETSPTESIRDAFGRSHLPELSTAYWEQALSRTMQYSLWNTPNYPNTQNVNQTLLAATCPGIKKNEGVARYTGGNLNEYQWDLALRTAFDHYKLSTEEALNLRECRTQMGLKPSFDCLTPLRKLGHEFWGQGPFQPWMNAKGIASGPFLFYTHSVAFPPPMTEVPRVRLGPRELKPIRLLYKTIAANGTETIRTGMLCQPRLWKNPRLEPYLKAHPL
ncbi:MAG: hypothetical protein K2X47_10805 [Bdellovibrionales bacterium]|nr:hypothetical protein [Bdellovibrionales bacterium]